MGSCRYVEYQTNSNDTGIDFDHPRRQDRSQYLAETPTSPIRNQNGDNLTSVRDPLDTNNVLDTLPAAVVVIDQFGCINYFNNKAAVYLGPLKMGEQWGKAIERCFREPTSNDEIFTTRGYILSLTTEPMPDKKGQMIVFHDISKASELKKTRERYARLVELGELSARMAHQIRTPLASSMLFLSNIKDSMDSSSRPYKNLIRGIQSLRNIENMIKDMLLFSSDKSGHGETLDIADLVYALKNDTEVLRQQYSCEIAFECTDTALEIKGNLYAIKSAISNIIENSAQACMAKKKHYEEKGEKYSANINVSIFPCARIDNYSISMKIIDNGTGIPDENINNILKPFYTTRQNGTGLGLAVVKSVIDAHNGELQINSSLDSGTEIIVRLP